jgi:hypothetical protein
MPRRPSQITQADIARVIRAAKQVGAAEVIICVGEQSMIVRLTPSTDGDNVLATPEEIVL